MSDSVPKQMNQYYCENAAKFDLILTLNQFNDVVSLGIRLTNDIFDIETTKILLNKSVSLFSLLSFSDINLLKLFNFAIVC